MCSELTGECIIIPYRWQIPRHWAKGRDVTFTSSVCWGACRPFVRRAHQKKLPIASLNLGVTRADDLLDQKFVGDCEEVLEALGRKFL